MYKTDFSKEFNLISQLGIEVKELGFLLSKNSNDKYSCYNINNIGNYLYNFPYNENRTKHNLAESIIELSKILKQASGSISSAVIISFVKYSNYLIKKLVSTYNSISY